jgi:peptide subunit release factor 1 (eRF1)
LGSASRAQRKGDEQTRHNLRRVVKDIEGMVDRDDLQRIILAGAPEVTGELRNLLPKRLASRVVGTVDVATSASIDEIRDVVTPIAEKAERDTEEATVSDLITSAAKSGNSVVGLQQTLDALNQHRVWRFVWADGFQAPGYVCSQCGALFSVDTACSLCGSPVVGTEDVVETAIDVAVRRGARIEVVRGDEAKSSLMNAGGIGAYLRTRKPRARAS